MKIRIPTLLFVALVCAVSSSAQNTAGSWSLFPPQATIHTTSVQQPINQDGTSNFKWNGKGVIPVKFEAATSYGPVIFHSIGSDTDTGNDFSFLSFTPSGALTFNDLTTLKADYTFTEGNCHGGALRWSIRVSATQSIFVYYGAHPNFTDCGGVGGNSSNSQSGVNMLSLTDARFDTSQIPGGTFYDTYANAQALVGTMQIIRVSLVLDGGWAGDQVLQPSNVTVNDNTFVPLSGGGPTCTLPAATIQITKISGTTTGAVNEPLTIQPFDDDSVFRVVDCKYMYNLATSSLPGVGRYKVEAVINGSPAPGAALFDLR